MALKADRFIDADDISFFMPGTGEAGYFVVHNTSGSGAALDQDDATVALPTVSVSGTKPAGLLLNDVVDIDLTRLHINHHKDEVPVGSKVRLLRRGWTVTNAVSGTPTAGDPAYYEVGGKLRATNPTNGVIVGRFLSSKDEDGYAKVEINIYGN